ncbi:MAG: asparagine synthase (glutamine-hydrolyzing), partial [Acidobacteriota bacterium]|nr:asparagine synthase (glutamine-hydrolyzing) [Acidobacteriota bacterium]
MCGIAGVVCANRTAESAVRSMLSTMHRRGPDGEGLREWPHAMFGHRRLAILDLSPAGAQPMLSPDGRVGVVFNGCIYNFQQIRSELEGRGRRFRSQCDTEVLIEGYLEWGIDRLVQRLRGMYAFVVWDDPLQTLFAVRDRLGVKPLIYSAGNGVFAFASTLDALRAGGFGGPMDPQSALEMLDLGYVTDRRCIYSGVSKLPPATILEWREGEISERSYWDLPLADEETRLDFEEAVARTEELLLESVKLRLISDVPVGALLSGGIDSAVVCWALSHLNADVQAYTAGTPGDPEDESNDARDIARRLGIRHTVVALDPDEAPPFDDFIQAFSEPFASPSVLGLLQVSRIVRSKATVLLTGDGGDEAFLGYNFFENAWRAERLARRLPASAPAVWSLVRPYLRKAPALKRAVNFLDYTVGGVGAYARVRLGLPYFEERGMLGDRLRGRNVAHREIPASFESARHLTSDVVRFQWRMHFLSEFLVKVDGSTMYHSLEARSPLLDQKLWEFAADIPPRLHFHQGSPKAILREIVRRRVGPTVAGRRKQGFTIPVEKWLATEWKDRLREMQTDAALVRGGWMDGPALARAVDA